MTPDVNLLVAAFRGDHSHHRVAQDWLVAAREACAEGRHSLVLLPMVVTGFPRLVTHNRVFTSPDTIADAMAFLDIVVDAPGVDLSAARNGLCCERCCFVWNLKAISLPTPGLLRRSKRPRST